MLQNWIQMCLLPSSLLQWETSLWISETQLVNKQIYITFASTTIYSWTPIHVSDIKQSSLLDELMRFKENPTFAQDKSQS